MRQDRAVPATAGAQGSSPTATGHDAPANRVVRLSRREAQVALLIARGRTNQQIATALVVSVRTAEGHVHRLMRKLGATSRVQVATWVLAGRHGTPAVPGTAPAPAPPPPPSGTGPS
jgi:DNA-binding NarL/FixJ family response regulator